MKRYLLSVWLLVALALIQIFGATVSAAEDMGEKLVRKFFSDVKAENLASIEKTLAEGLQVAHSFGPLDRAGELKLIRAISRLPAMDRSWLSPSRLMPPMRSWREKELPPGPMNGWPSGLRSRLAGNSLPMPT